MSVYVDPLRHWGWHIRGRAVESCHMVADTDDELHEMADKLNLKRQWAQHMTDPNQYRHHYDLTLTKRDWAVVYGAVEISYRDLGRKLIAERARVRTYANVVDVGQAVAGECLLRVDGRPCLMPPTMVVDVPQAEGWLRAEFCDDHGQWAESMAQLAREGKAEWHEDPETGILRFSAIAELAADNTMTVQAP